MIHYKTPKEIETMKTGGHILAEILQETLNHVKPGITEGELDKLAEKLIRQSGAKPGFMEVKGYHNTICASTNDVVVHGIPGSRTLNEGDIIGIDCGVFYEGLHTDMSETVGVGKIDKDTQEFLRIGKFALEEAIKVAKPGNRIGNISQTIQDIVEGAGYSIVRNLIGHGVGKSLHEDPEVPGFLAEPVKNTLLLKEGLTIAIEVIYNMGKPDVMLDKDGWTIKTKDHAISGVFERTVAITKNETIMLTK